ncbi:actin-histidine N-methyltransferase-like [Haliotis asinina]|uniref:actin-histidine N-methyltransferase-like n=1 Tax=Haliotis asinina TaxID=109174 RepID=UPI0035323902
MGRKSKKGGGGKQAAKENTASTEGASQTQVLPKAAKRDVTELVNQLLDICSKPPATGSKEWDDYPEIHGLVEKIRKIQSAIAPPEKSRDQCFPAFLEWLANNGVDTASADIVQYPDLGYGLKANKDLKESELFLSIPRKLMLTVDSAKKSVLGNLISEDKILQAMPNITLALHLLCEKWTPDSLWKPYIDIMPTSYTTPLYFSQEELQQFKGSPALGDSLNQYRNISRQYAYFYRLLQKNPKASNLPIKDIFTFDEYRWAVSTVMTRQNQIPTKDGSQATFGLIPFWDMCNHSNGYFTADYSVEKDCSECYTLREFKAEEQIFIFYGARSNAEFLVHNGFVYPENEHDRLCLKLGISKGDPLFAAKAEVLNRIGLQPSRAFFLHVGDNPVDGDLLAFLRVFNMEEDPLKSRFGSAASQEDMEQLKDLDTPVTEENEQKVWTFLQTRAAILLKAYPTTLEADEEQLKKSDLSPALLLALQLRTCEKKILQTTVEYATQRKAGSQQQQQQQNGS